jgi:ATP diphosphatase
MNDLKEELGDLLLQVVFHAQMATEQGLFDFNDVVETLTKKLVSRHPHVFGEGEAKSAEDVMGIWNAAKEKEPTGHRQPPSPHEGGGSCGFCLLGGGCQWRWPVATP